MRIRHVEKGCKIGSILMVLALFNLASASTAYGVSRYAITDFGTYGSIDPNSVLLEALNDAGQVIGSFQISGSESGQSEEWNSFLWDNGEMTNLGTLGGQSCEAYGINNVAQIVGIAETASGERHAFLWDSGEMTDLGTLGSDWSVAIGINDAGQIVGHSDTANGIGHVFLWENGQMIDLGTLGGDWSRAEGINNAGQIIGSAESRGGESRAVLWENGQTTELGPFEGYFPNSVDINDSGQVIGFYMAYNGFPLSFFWEDGSLRDIGTFPGLLNFNSLWGINNSGQVVGYSWSVTSDQEHRPFLWDNGEIWDLNDLIPEDSGVQLFYAHDINEQGQILARGRIDGVSHSYLLTPIPETDASDLGHKAVSSEKQEVLGSLCMAMGIVLMAGLVMGFGLLDTSARRYTSGQPDQRFSR